VSHEMEVEDFLVIVRRENAVLREQAQTQMEQISNLTLALDEALAIARRYRGGNTEEETL
jgi:hypothetical protein